MNTEESAFAGLLGVVLAGGKSSRMGQDKAMIRHHSGMSFLDFSIARLKVLTPDVAVSGRSAMLPDVHSIPDIRPSLGPAMAVWSSICFAKSMNFTRVLVTPVDMPAIEPVQLKKLIDVHLAGHPGGAGRPACATFGDDIPHPLVAVYPVSSEPELAAVVNSARRSLREWLMNCDCDLVVFPEREKLDCNAPGDIDAAEKL
jgi:molybdopterin-guanine dinucleotide biosynthesis protein A